MLDSINEILSLYMKHCVGRHYIVDLTQVIIYMKFFKRAFGEFKKFNMK